MIPEIRHREMYRRWKRRRIWSLVFIALIGIAAVMIFLSSVAAIAGLIREFLYG